MISITDNKEFWWTIHPLLSDKVTVQTKISLVEKGYFLSNEKMSLKCSVTFLKMLLRN